jgi:hypothetical protein
MNRNAVLFDLSPHGVRQHFTGDNRAAQRKLGTHLAGLVENDLEKAGCTAVCSSSQLLRCSDLQLSAANARWDDHTAKRTRRRVEHEAHRREVITTCIQHNIAAQESRHAQRLRETPVVSVRSLRIE